MKKRTLALLVCAMLLFAACGSPAPTTPPGDTPPADTPPPAETVRMIMATGGTGGTYYPFGGAMAAVINENTNMQFTVEATGASAANLRLLEAGDAHVALAQNDVMYYAFNGVGTWVEHDPITSLATLMTLYPETVQIVVDAGSGIYSVEDLAGRRVSVGDVGSGVEANARQVLAAHGITFDDIEEFNLGFGPSADAMRDGLLDAFFVTAAAPNTAVMELATARDLRILNIDEARAAALIADYPFYVRVTLTSDDYAWLTEPVHTLAVQATLVTTIDLDEQLAYDIVRVLINYAADIGHARGAYINAENAVSSISVDFHPGARRFFEEIGALS